MGVEFQKILGATLFALILTVGVGLLGDIVFPQHEAPEEAAAVKEAAPAPAGKPTEEPEAKEAPAAVRPAEQPPGGGDAGGIAALIAEATPEQGQKAARKCTPCHTFDEGGANRVGPNLHGVVGSDIASKEYRYSAALAGKDGAWTDEKLNEFLTSPAAWAPGTKMTFAGLKQAEERAAIIAYLRSVSPEAPPH